MNITVNQKIINRILSEASLCDEIKIFLNNIIDGELEKEDNMDTQLIDDCVDALIELESGNVPEFNENSKIVRFCHRKTNGKRIYIQRAAAIILIVSTASVITLNANPALASGAKSFFESVAYHLGIAADKTDTQSDVVSVYATMPSTFNARVKSEKEISLKGTKIYAVHSDGSEEEIPLSDCEITTQTQDDNGEKKIILIVSYKGCAVSIVYTQEV